MVSGQVKGRAEARTSFRALSCDALSTAVVDASQATKALGGRVVDTALGGVSQAGEAIQYQANRLRGAPHTAQPTEENFPAGGPSSPADNHGEADFG